MNQQKKKRWKMKERLNCWSGARSKQENDKEDFQLQWTTVTLASGLYVYFEQIFLLLLNSN
jgi:hypothetical protein